LLSAFVYVMKTLQDDKKSFTLVIFHFYLYGIYRLYKFYIKIYYNYLIFNVIDYEVQRDSKRWTQFLSLYVLNTKRRLNTRPDSWLR
jgi:hypothetical protein